MRLNCSKASCRQFDSIRYRDQDAALCPMWHLFTPKSCLFRGEGGRNEVRIRYLMWWRNLLPHVKAVVVFIERTCGFRIITGIFPLQLQSAPVPFSDMGGVLFGFWAQYCFIFVVAAAGTVLQSLVPMPSASVAQA